MSGLSSRVMNMKFMQKADAADTQHKEEEQKKKIKDMSEWVSPYSKTVIAKVQSNNNIETVGYGSINAFGDVDEGEDNFYENKPSVRRTWGAPKPVELEELKKDNGSNANEAGSKPKQKKSKKQSKHEDKTDTPEVSAGGSLDDLWKSLSGKSTGSDNAENSGATQKADKKRTPEPEYVPKITKKRKRFN